MQSKKEKAYAKINVYLDIQNKREDGFHNIFTLMQLVSLYDSVEVILDGSGAISVEMINSPLDIPTEKNIAYLAAQKFYEKLGNSVEIGAKIIIEKRIPMAAGLAGGSADAAAVLRALNELYEYPCTTEELLEIGASLGSDVPFSIVGGAQLCQGRGEKMYSTSGIQHYNILIAYAGEKMSTSEQYKQLDRKFNDFLDYPLKESFQAMHRSFATGRCIEGFNYMYNVFETLYEDDSTFKEIKRIMYKNEATKAMLSGSGPSIFGVFPNRFYAEDAQAELEKLGITTFLCNPINREYKDILNQDKPWK